MAYLEITLKVKENNRSQAAAVYARYKAAFLSEIKGAKSKELLVRDEDVQVLHGFDSLESAQGYLATDLFKNDVVKALAPLLEAEPEVRLYSLA